MLENKIVLDSDVRVLFQGDWSPETVITDEINSTRVIDSDFERVLISSWGDTLKVADEKNQKIWDSTIYRFESCKVSSQKLHLDLSTIPFSIRLEMNKYTDKIKQLGLLYSPRGMFNSCLVKTSDDYAVFVEKSNVYVTQKKYAWVGGVFSKSEFIINSGNDLFESAKREIVEELGVEKEYIIENILKMGYLTENWNVCFLFSVQLSLTKKELSERFRKYSDDEVKNLIFFTYENIKNSLNLFEPKDKIKFALLKIC